MALVPLSTVPNGVPIMMQMHMKVLQPQPATPCISHAAALCPPGPPQKMNMIPAISLSQSPPPHVTTFPTEPANDTAGGSPSPASPPSESDTDSVKLLFTSNGNVMKGAITNRTNQHFLDLIPSSATESQQATLPPVLLWNGVALLLQQTPSLDSQQQDTNTALDAGSPSLTHMAASVLPARTPSANDTRSVSRPGAMGSSVGHMIPEDILTALATHVNDEDDLTTAATSTSCP
ncbi:hypothetical protein HD554DRAFT_2043921 [Boletus coccyginus]|nr:hypothetical protein HD554DRAFT_2043921 [Boletus coccyginus]